MIAYITECRRLDKSCEQRHSLGLISSNLTETLLIRRRSVLMEHIKNLFGDTEIASKKSDTSKITNSRQLIIKDFLDILNPQRESAGYKPLSPQMLAVKLGHVSTEDLQMFYGQCRGAQNFTKYFWYKLK